MSSKVNESLCLKQRLFKKISFELGFKCIQNVIRCLYVCTSKCGYAIGITIKNILTFLFFSSCQELDKVRNLTSASKIRRQLQDAQEQDKREETIRGVIT